MMINIFQDLDPPIMTVGGKEARKVAEREEQERPNKIPKVIHFTLSTY